MLENLSTTTWNIIFLSVFFVFIISLLIYAVISSISKRKAYRKLLETLQASQQKFFAQAVESLTSKLEVYTDTVLVEKTNENYKKLISKELLPEVNNAAKRIAELSEAVSSEQQKSLEKLAERLSELMISPAREYIQSEAEIISSLNKGVSDFSSELQNITKTVQEAAELQETSVRLSEMANNSVITLNELLTEKINGLSEGLNAVNNALLQNQQLVTKNSEIVLSLMDSVKETKTALDESQQLFLQQNQDISNNLSETVNLMSQNTELAANKLIEGFCDKMEAAAQSSNQVLGELQSVAERIESSSVQFSEGLEKIYESIGEKLKENLAEAGSILSQVVSGEYEKISESAQHYANAFSEHTENLGADLEKHISNLKFITERLNESINLYKMDVEASSQSFRVNMEGSVSSVLEQMDQSLAQIVERLVNVTLNIQEAADALPKAVKAMQKEGKN